MSQLFSKGYAVIIGVGADLPVTVKDAGAIATQLSDPTRCAFPHEQVRLLTNESARRKDILTALSWLSDEAKQNDTAIVYFSGHGMETPNFHLVPFGYDPDNLTDTAITGQEFTDCLRSIQARKLLVLLDCCHAGGQAEAKTKGYRRSPLPATVIHELGNSSGRVVLASSRKDELSWTSHPYSQFTKAVLEGLSGYGAFEQDGYARVLDLAFWVSRVVPERTNDEQHPIIKVSNLEDNFALAWYSGSEKTLKLLPWSSHIPDIPARDESTELVTWQRMRANYRRNLLLIEERMSEYVDSVSIPIQLVKEKRETETKITELEEKLGSN